MGRFGTTSLYLSYVCGNVTVKENILVDGKPLRIYVTFATALRHVCHLWPFWKPVFPERDTSSFEPWAEAICINEADISERNQQVLLIADICHSAELVLSWLGVGDRLTNLALETFELMAMETDGLFRRQT